ncbi:MAG: class I SAM-dependent methyltransferase [Prochlorotrichaceae cyanobacterium]
MNTIDTERREQLRRSFYKIAQQIAPANGLHLEIGGAFFRKLSISLTRLCQITGYNKRKLQAYKNEPILLNIGCGDMTKAGCIRTDILPSGGEFLKLLVGQHKIKNELFLDITYLDQHLLNCAEGIILSHVLEHLPAIVAPQALKCCFQYLKPGGCLRVSVPFLGKYDQDSWPKAQELVSPFLGKNLLIYGWGHRFMYDTELLALLMEEAGFCKVQEVQYQEGALGEFDTTWRKAQSIYVLGYKPS